MQLNEDVEIETPSSFAESMGSGLGAIISHWVNHLWIWVRNFSTVSFAPVCHVVPPLVSLGNIEARKTGATHFPRKKKERFISSTSAPCTDTTDRKAVNESIKNPEKMTIRKAEVKLQLCFDFYVERYTTNGIRRIKTNTNTGTFMFNHGYDGDRIQRKYTLSYST